MGKADLTGQIGKKSHLEKQAVEKVRQMFTIVKKMLYKNFTAHIAIRDNSKNTDYCLVITRCDVAPLGECEMAFEGPHSHHDTVKCTLTAYNL